MEKIRLEMIIDLPPPGMMANRVSTSPILASSAVLTICNQYTQAKVNILYSISLENCWFYIIKLRGIACFIT